MRADFTFEIPPGRIASSTSATRRVAHLLPAREARRAGAGRPRRGCGRSSTARAPSARAPRSGGRAAAARDAVGLAQAVADPQHPRARGRAPGRGGGRAACGARGHAHKVSVRRRRYILAACPRLSENLVEIDGLPVFWRSAPSPTGRPPVLYLHGVPESSDEWVELLGRTGGLAPDLPGFGRSGKPGSLDVHDRRVRPLHRALPRRDGRRARADARARLGRRRARLRPAPPGARSSASSIVNAVPFLPGYRWHRTARIWRTPLLGELAMGTTGRFTARLASREANVTPGPMPEAWLDSVLSHFDQGTQRAILRLYRSSPSQVLEQAGAPPRRAACAGARRLGHEGSLHTRPLRGGLRGGAARTQSCSSCPTRGTGRGSTARTYSTGSRSSCPRGDRAGAPGPRVDAHRGARADLRDPRPRRAPTSRRRATAATSSRKRGSRCGTTRGTADTTCSPTRCSRRRSGRCSVRACSQPPR